MRAGGQVAVCGAICGDSWYRAGQHSGNMSDEESGREMSGEEEYLYDDDDEEEYEEEEDGNDNDYIAQVYKIK
jgi:hypothetical protein